KKILLSLVVAAAALFATSCANELDENIKGNGNGVTFEISTPELASRAFGDGESVAKLMYAVYEVGQNGYTKVDGVSCTDGVTFDGSKTTVAIDLLDGYTYDILFWAAGENYTSAYTIDWDTKTVTMNGTIPSNNDAFDGFYKHITVTVNGAVTENVTLERPFAQLNIGTSDLEEAAKAGFNKDNFTSSVVVKGMPNVLDCATGNVSGTADIEYTATAIDSNEVFGITGYEYVAMNYVLVGADKQLANIELTVEGGKKITNTYNNVPFQRNYKTNVYGALLTNGSQFTVDINENWATETLPNEEGDKLILAAQMGGEYTLTENAVLPSTLEVTADMVINLNGYTLSAANAKGDGAVVNVANGVSAKLVGGIVKNTTENGDAVINNEGTLELKDIEIVGAPLADGGYSAYAVISSGKLTINEGTVVSADRGCLKFSGAGETVINGGSFTNNDIGSRSLTSHVVDVEDGGSHKLTINGGTFKHLHTATSGGVVICNRTTGVVNINGGSYSGGNYYGNDNLSDYGYGGTFSVKGGTYTAKPAAKYIATGYKAVESNGKWVVVADEVDAVVSTQDALNNTTINDNDTVVLTAGAYVIPAGASGKTLTIQGTGNPEDVTVTAQNAGAAEGNCDYSLRGSTATFNDVTITTTGTYFPGYAGLKGTFNNCIINGVYTVYDNSTFNNCTFNIEGDLYNLWTWGGAEVVLNNCTFNCDGKAVLLYGQVNTKLTVNNCTFNDNGGLADLKAAIEIGNDYGKSYELIVNNTTVNGFEINDKGYVTGTTLWANKNSMPADKLKVTVDGKNAYTIVAADAAGLNSAIAVGATNVILEAGNYTMPEPDLRGKSLTIVGTKDVVIDATAVDARDQFVTGATLVFDGVTVNFGTTNYMGFANAASLTYKNCDINGLQFLFNPTSFENCKFNSTGEHCVWTYGSKQVSFTNCEFTYADRCVNVYVDNGTEDVAVDFTNCKFNTANAASAGAVEINAEAFPQGANVDFDGCTAPANGHMVFISKWDRTVGATANVTVDGVAYTTPVQQ
ncbi:MAG: hypothetical protein J6V28_01450, partial [Tidjanibacter sp.]|nr:hypothetical protein [Tidjanibacter sp.]